MLASSTAKRIPLPAHQTKDVKELDYPLPSGAEVTITQDDSQTDSTGRTVWLGAQVLAVYLHDLLKKERPFTATNGAFVRRRRALDLGGGTGLLALSLHQMEHPWDVVSTDVPFIADGVLAANLMRNARPGAVLQARALDWFDEPSQWDWNRWSISRPPATDTLESAFEQVCDLLQPPFDLIVSSDTLYHPDLIQPLLRVLHTVTTPPLAPKPPLVYIALEVRDPDLIASFLVSAKEWGFKCSRTENGKLEKLMGEGGLGWCSEDWEGVQVWRLRPGRRSLEILQA